MEKIQLLKNLWRLAAGEVIEVSTLRAEFAIRKGFAKRVKEEKAEQAEYLNKAEKKPRKNK